MKETPVVNLSELQDKRLHWAQVNELGALMLGGYIEGDSLICGLLGCDNPLDTRVSEYDNEIRGLQKEIQIDKIDGIQLKKGNNGMECPVCHSQVA